MQYSPKRIFLWLLIAAAVTLGTRWYYTQTPKWFHVERVGLYTLLNIQFYTSQEQAEAILLEVDELLSSYDVHLEETQPSHPFYKLAHAPKHTQVSLNPSQDTLFRMLDSTISQYEKQKGLHSPLQLGAAEWLHRMDLISKKDSSHNRPWNPHILDSLQTLMKRDYYTYDSSRRSIELLVDSLHMTLGAVSKGYGIQQIQSILESHHVPRYLINAGGDMAYRGKNPKDKSWSIGIQHPRSPKNTTQLLGILTTPPYPFQGIATSGDYERASIINGERVHHLIHGITGKPVTNKQSLTVLSHNPLKADLMATLLFTLPIQEALEFGEQDSTLELLIVDSLGNTHSSKFMKDLFQKR